MYRRLKRIALLLMKLVGLFHLARFLTRRGLRILCYHGLSVGDEHVFRPGLFMQPDTVKERFRLLRRRGFAVLGLDEALERLALGTLPPHATVVTVDDGFYSLHRDLASILREVPLPCTVYVTTYYAVKRNPIYRLVIQYMFWKTKARELDLASLPGFPRTGTVRLDDPDARFRTMSELVRHGESELDEPGRVALARELGARLGVDYDQFDRGRGLSIMGEREIGALVRAGVDIQLHTHRHRFPREQALAEREIRDNREVLEPLTGRRLTHFCYPSGGWAKEQLAWLEQLGVTSATTCDPGFNYDGAHPLLLKRFLDGEDITPLEFEAEVCGVNEVARRLKARLVRRRDLESGGRPEQI